MNIQKSDGYWLNFKIETLNNPIIDLKNKYPEAITRLTPHIQYEKNVHLVDITVKDREALSSLKTFIEYQDDRISFQKNSLMKKQDGIGLFCWTQSPSFDLIKHSLLTGYKLQNHNPSEYFAVFSNNKKDLLNIIKNGIQIVEGGIEGIGKKIDWFIGQSPAFYDYGNGNLFQAYKYSIAKDVKFFYSYNAELLGDLSTEIQEVTSMNVTKEELAKEMIEFEKSLF